MFSQNANIEIGFTGFCLGLFCGRWWLFYYLGKVGVWWLEREPAFETFWIVTLLSLLFMIWHCHWNRYGICLTNFQLNNVLKKIFNKKFSIKIVRDTFKKKNFLSVKNKFLRHCALSGKLKRNRKYVFTKYIV